MTSGQASAATPTRGRPRDPGLEDRVFDAAIALYAETGWAGFSFEAVARRAGVGKAGLYSRWPSRQVLLRQTLEARWLKPERFDTGALRSDLVSLARQLFGVLTSPYAGAARWMAIDRVNHAEAREATAPYSDAAIRQGRAIVRRAILRGELAGEVNPGLVMDLVVGGVTNHVGTTPARLRGAMIDKMDAFSTELVETVLKGVGAAPQRT